MRHAMHSLSFWHVKAPVPLPSSNLGRASPEAWKLEGTGGGHACGTCRVKNRRRAWSGHGAFGLPCCDEKADKAFGSHDAVPIPAPTSQACLAPGQIPSNARNERAGNSPSALLLFALLQRCTNYLVRTQHCVRKAPPLPSQTRCSARSACPQRSGTGDSGLSRHRTGQPRLSSKQSCYPTTN